MSRVMTTSSVATEFAIVVERCVCLRVPERRMPDYLSSGLLARREGRSAGDLRSLGPDRAGVALIATRQSSTHDRHELEQANLSLTEDYPRLTGASPLGSELRDSHAFIIDIDQSERPA